MAEQIGAQIFIDGFGLVSPGDPELAVNLRKKQEVWVMMENQFMELK